MIHPRRSWAVALVACALGLAMLAPAISYAQNGEAAEMSPEEELAVQEAAQEIAAQRGFSINFAGPFGGAIGAGIVMLAAGAGIGRIGSSAVESMARQPEVAGNVQTGMLISAALIEGATFFALIVCLLAVFS